MINGILSNHNPLPSIESHPFLSLILFWNFLCVLPLTLSLSLSLAPFTAQQGDEMSTYNAPGKIDDPAAVQDNTEWEQLLHEFVKNPPKGGDDADARNDLMLQELGDRIADLQAVQDILNKKKDEEVPQEEVDEQAGDLLNAVAQRHNDTEDKVQATVNPNDAEDVAKLDAFKANDTNYRQALANFVGQMQEEEPEAERWWLDKDDDRRAHYDTIMVEQQQNEILAKDAVCDIC